MAGVGDGSLGQEGRPQAQANVVIVNGRVPADLEGARLDRTLAALVDDVSRSQAKAAIESGDVMVGGDTVTDPRHKVSCGDTLSGSVSLGWSVSEVSRTSMPLSVVHEDDDMLVVDKPPGLVVHPAPGHWHDTLANAVAARCPAAAGLPRVGVVHRLDKDTSGLVAIARTAASMGSLQRQFQTRRAKREYLAIVHGTPPATGVVDVPLGRDRKNRLKMGAHDRGRKALTRYSVLGTAGGFSLLRCLLESGRTHQIRVHMEHVGHPVAGDRLYKRHSRPEGGVFPRQMLHARSLSLTHPASGETMSLTAPLPADFLRAMDDVRLAAP